MLNRGELCIRDAARLKTIGDYKNIERILTYMNAAYPIAIEKLEDQEKRLFQNAHHLTSAARFLQAVRDRNFELAREIT